MMSSPKDSLPTGYFDKMYQENTDPWNFATSDYERKKYAATLAALPRAHYERVFEIGCSIGVLTGQLAPRCQHLLSVDGSAIPLAQASSRLQSYENVTLKQMKVPDTFPEGSFDLILVSEVGYYWSWEDLAKARQLIISGLRPGGHLLLVHWTPYVADYPLTGDEVHEAFIHFGKETNTLTALTHQRADTYRLDLFERSTRAADIRPQRSDR